MWLLARLALRFAVSKWKNESASDRFEATVKRLPEKTMIKFIRDDGDIDVLTFKEADEVKKSIDF